MALCILCKNEEATTGEHIFKADRYRQLLGSTPCLYIVDGSETRRNIRSANNKLLTPKKNLCVKCNSHKSQPADRVFSDLDRFLHDEIYRQVNLGNKEIALDALPFFQNKDALDYLHFIRYFAKFLACQLDRNEYLVPGILRQIFLEGEGFRHLKITITGDGSFIGLPIMKNSGLGCLLDGIAGDVTVKLAKLGILPEEIHTKIQHGPITYSLLLEVPESEIVASAQSILDANMNTAFELLNIPLADRKLFVNAPAMQKAEAAHAVFERYLESLLSDHGVPLLLFKILRKLFGFIYKVKSLFNFMVFNLNELANKITFLKLKNTRKINE